MRPHHLAAVGDGVVQVAAVRGRRGGGGRGAGGRDWKKNNIKCSLFPVCFISSQFHFTEDIWLHQKLGTPGSLNQCTFYAVHGAQLRTRTSACANNCNPLLLLRSQNDLVSGKNIFPTPLPLPFKHVLCFCLTKKSTWSSLLTWLAHEHEFLSAAPPEVPECVLGPAPGHAVALAVAGVVGEVGDLEPSKHMIDYHEQNRSAFKKALIQLWRAIKETALSMWRVTEPGVSVARFSKERQRKRELEEKRRNNRQTL